MIITLNVTRMKRDDEVWEIFTVTPHFDYLHNPKYYIDFVLWKLRNHIALAPRLELKKIVECGNKIIYIYYWNSNETKMVDMSVSFQIPYYPIRGKRTCSVCAFERVFDNGESYCFWKGKKIDKYSHYKCRDWSERSLNSRQGKHVHKSRGSVKDRRTY